MGWRKMIRNPSSSGQWRSYASGDPALGVSKTLRQYRAPWAILGLRVSGCIFAAWYPHAPHRRITLKSITSFSYPIWDSGCIRLGTPSHEIRAFDLVARSEDVNVRQSESTSLCPSGHSYTAKFLLRAPKMMLTVSMIIKCI